MEKELLNLDSSDVKEAVRLMSKYQNLVSIDHLSKYLVSVLLLPPDVSLDVSDKSLYFKLLTDAGIESPNFYRKLIENDALFILANHINSNDSNLVFASIHLLCKLIVLQELSFSELAVFDSNWISHLLDFVIDSDSSEFKNIIFTLMLLLSNEFNRKNSTLLIEIIKQYRQKEFSESLLYYINGLEDETLQRFFLEILPHLLNSTEYFYTNDLSVLVDIILRQLVRVSSDDLRLLYLKMIPPIINLITGTPMENTFNDRGKAITVLKRIKESGVAKSHVKLVAEKVLVEITK